MTDPQPILELIFAFRRSKTMFAATSLGVFDKLQHGPAGIDSFPELNADALERLLNSCVSMGLLQKDGNMYRNTALTERYLCRNSPDTLAGYILYSNSALFPMWAHLEDAVREGTNRWEPTFGFPSADLFQHFFNTDQQKRDFLLGMNGLGQLSSPAVVRAFDLSRFSHFVDLGGGTGHLARAAAVAYPNMRVSVFDLATTLDFAREFDQGRVGLIAGDFFNDPLPPADLFALGRILHDWAEPKIIRLLERVHSALPSGGAVLIAECLLNDDNSGPTTAHMHSMNMLVCTEGKERNLEEYSTLLKAVGFTNVQGFRTGTPLDVVFGVKP